MMQTTNSTSVPPGKILLDHHSGSLLPPVCFVGFVTGQCGDAIQMMELASGVQATGRQVQLIVPDMKTTHGYAARCTNLNLPVELSPLINADQMGQTHQSVFNIIRLLRRIRHSVVHFHTGDLVLPRKALIALQTVRLNRLYVTVHNPSDYLSPTSSRARLWVATVKRCVTKVICPSEHSFNIQRRLGVPAEKLLLIRNGVDVGIYGHGDAEGVLHGPLSHLPHDAQIVLHTARMEPGKRPQDVLEAFQRIAPEYPKAHLVFAGIGDMRDQLADSVSPSLRERVHFVGFQTNISDWLAAATAWVHASEGENFSAALLQAFAAGIPIAATMCSGNNEVLVPGVNSLTFMPGEVENLAAALHRLLRDKELRSTLSAAARLTAHEHSLEAMVKLHNTQCFDM